MMPADVTKFLRYGIPASVLAGMLGVLYFINPGDTTLIPPCPFHWLTGHHCPGCGSLRALHQLLHGNLATALSLNPLMVVSLPVLAGMVWRPSWTYRRWVPWCALGILILYGVIRNIPFWPFIILAPA